MYNIPKVKIGIVAVSRDCFPESLSVNRRKALVEAYAANMMQQTSMNVRSVSLKAKFTWFRLWKMLRQLDVTQS